MVTMDVRFMKMALKLARRGMGRVSPNPMVGAVLVRDGQILARGYHRGAGLDHAEIDALKSLGGQAEGATLYVNLEPCCHQSKTPPCMTAIKKAGISRVVIGMQDPNPLVNGRGIAWLREQGIVVDLGVLEPQCQSLNRAFVHWVTNHRPFLTLKLAMTLDGRIADRNGRARWISGKAAQKQTHRWRVEMDSVWVGAETVVLDDPFLLPVLVPMRRPPLRVVVDSMARIPMDSQLVKTVSQGPVLVATTHRADPNKLEALRAAGVKVWRPDASMDAQRVPLLALADYLGAQGICSGLVEGGATLGAGLVKDNLIQRLHVYVAPMLLGDAAARPMMGDLGIVDLPDAIRWKVEHSRRIGEDVLIEMTRRED